MKNNRRTSWKTSSQRRSRPGSINAGNNSPNNGSGNSSQYAQQLNNPYRSLRGSSAPHSDAARSRGMRSSLNDQSVEEERGVNHDHAGENDIENEEDDDDDLGLDEILSGIEGITGCGGDKKDASLKPKFAPSSSIPQAPPPPPPPPLPLPIACETPEFVVENGENHAPSQSGAKHGAEDSREEKKSDGIDLASSSNNKNSLFEKPRRPQISSVDFGNDRATTNGKGPRTNNDFDAGNSRQEREGSFRDENLTQEEDCTLLSDGDATRQHKILVQSGQGPMFSSGGFDDSAMRASHMSSQQDVGDKAMFLNANEIIEGDDSVNSFLDEVEDDFLGYDINKNDDIIHESHQMQQSIKSPPRGKVSLHPTHTSTTPIQPVTSETVPRSVTQLNTPISESTSHAYNPEHTNSRNDKPPLHNRDNSAPTENILGEVHHHNNQEDETLSTVTDPTESPFIYTYKNKKPGRDDDSVSQITSSIAGGSYASSYLQNIPINIGGDGRSSRNRASNGLSWMGGATTGSRINYRKHSNRSRRTSPNGSSNGSGGSVRLDLDYGENDEGSQNGMDEIAYVLNTESIPTRNQRARRPLGRGGSCPVSLAEISSVCSADDVSTLDSRQVNFTRNRRIVTDYPDNVSKLGFGGVSCTGQSGSGNTVLSESTKSNPIGLIKGLASLARKTKHHATRFFLPHSANVERRKKFDRSDSSDSLEEILLEEGSRRRSRSHHDDEDIDYFSRAMSTTSASHSNLDNTRRQKQRTDGSLGNSLTQVVGTFLLVTVALTIYRGNVAEEDDSIKFNLETPPGGQPFDLQGGNSFGGYKDMGGMDIRQGGNDVRFDPAINSMMADTIEVVNEQLRRGGEQIVVDRQQPIEDSLDSMVIQPKPISTVVRLPSSFEALANVDEIPFQRGIDIPFYWHVPRSGGGTVNDVLGSCLHLTLAADAGGSDGHGQDETLKVLTFARQVSYVNVDTSSQQGIQRAKKLNLASSGLADVVISPLLHEAASLFTPTRRGRMFTIIRHPIERAVSLFYFIQDTQWKHPNTRNDQFADITIEDFYKGGFAENNWMTRFLTNELTKGELTEDDLNVAKEVLKRKCLIGLLEEKGETFERIEKYFGWKPKNSSEQECLEKKLEWAWPMKHRHYSVEEGTDAWYYISAQNKYDMQLYQYAKELFQHQEDLFH